MLHVYAQKRILFNRGDDKGDKDMTRTGITLQHYSELHEARPFSRFTSDAVEQQENSEWYARAMEWGETHVDPQGHWDGVA